MKFINLLLDLDLISSLCFWSATTDSKAIFALVNEAVPVPGPMPGAGDAGFKKQT